MMAPGSRAHTIERQCLRGAPLGARSSPSTAYSDAIEIRAHGVSAHPDVVVSVATHLSTPVEACPSHRRGRLAHTAVRDRVENGAYRRITSLSTRSGRA
jgi:hypothetical protein